MAKNKEVMDTLLKIKSAYKDAFATEAGQVVLDDLMKYCHMLGPTYRGDLDDTVYNEGMRNVVLYILSILNTDTAALRTRYENIQKEKEHGYFD